MVTRKDTEEQRSGLFKVVGCGGLVQTVRLGLFAGEGLVICIRVFRRIYGYTGVFSMNFGHMIWLWESRFASKS